MERRELGIISLTAWLAFGCASRAEGAKGADDTGQTYGAAVDLICHVDQRAGIDAEADPIAANGARWDFIRAEVTNPDAIYLRTILEVKDAREQAELLGREAEAKGLAACPLAEALASE